MYVIFITSIKLWMGNKSIDFDVVGLTSIVFGIVFIHCFFFWSSSQIFMSSLVLFKACMILIFPPLSVSTTLSFLL